MSGCADRVQIDVKGGWRVAPRERGFRSRVDRDRKLRTLTLVHLYLLTQIDPAIGLGSDFDIPDRNRRYLIDVIRGPNSAHLREVRCLGTLRGAHAPNSH